ncbi:MAG: PAS domain-containing protein [Alphaproteobacteria bacterium]|nr:PAS domain-containing protein [Alphaproteobacteria bacterium]
MNIVLSPIDRLHSEKLIGVYEAWKRTAAGRLAPKREEITPALLKSALPSIWMIDVIDGGRDYRFRIAGDRIIQFMGRRYAGHLLSEFQGQAFFDQMRGILKACTEQKRPLMAGPGRSKMPGREFSELEVVVLPLSEDGQNVTTVFGAMEIRSVPPAPKLPKGQ